MNKTRGRPRIAPKLRFYAKVICNLATGCELWTGATMPNGYGRFWDGERGLLAHHFPVGKPPAGLEWDHLCFVRNCVRPKHLELVTRTENMRRQRTLGNFRTVTQCLRGHAYDASNTRIAKNGSQVCRACMRMHMRNFRAKQHAT